ncbi:hypothetical protein C8R46DRAFT_1228252 [Mycena filopes]|nr:hypothetical protein C8R46DRAFT_1228252 [Mycena filopes]
MSAGGRAQGEAGGEEGGAGKDAMTSVEGAGQTMGLLVAAAYSEEDTSYAGLRQRHARRTLRAHTPITTIPLLGDAFASAAEGKEAACLAVQTQAKTRHTPDDAADGARRTITGYELPQSLLPSRIHIAAPSTTARGTTTRAHHSAPQQARGSAYTSLSSEPAVVVGVSGGAHAVGVVAPRAAAAVRAMTALRPSSPAADGRLHIQQERHAAYDGGVSVVRRTQRDDDNVSAPTPHRTPAKNELQRFGSRRKSAPSTQDGGVEAEDGEGVDAALVDAWSACDRSVVTGGFTLTAWSIEAARGGVAQPRGTTENEDGWRCGGREDGVRVRILKRKTYEER